MSFYLYKKDVEWLGFNWNGEIGRHTGLKILRL